MVIKIKHVKQGGDKPPEHFDEWFKTQEGFKPHSAEYHLAKEAYKQGQVNGLTAAAHLCERFANRMMSAEECADAIHSFAKTIEK
jgi:predicted DNA-binding ArsR family transcriptional regulator